MDISICNSSWARLLCNLSTHLILKKSNQDLGFGTIQVRVDTGAHNYWRYNYQSLRFKRFRKIRFRSKLLLGLIYGLAFGFQLHLIFQRIEFIRPIKYWIWRIFKVRIGAFGGLKRTKLNIENYSPRTKTNRGWFYFHWA